MMNNKAKIISRNDIICPICIKMEDPNAVQDEEDEFETSVKWIQVFGNWVDYAYHILEAHDGSDRVEWATLCLQDAGKPLKRIVVNGNGKKPVKQLEQTEEITIEPIEQPPKKVDPPKVDAATRIVDQATSSVLSEMKRLTEKDSPKPRKSFLKRLLKI